jgi:magnesium chelatase subunit I
MTYKEIPAQQLLKIKTIGELKAAGYRPKSIKQELRDNLIEKIRNK